MNLRAFDKRLIAFLVLVWTLSSARGQVKLRYDQNETVAWEEAVSMYCWLAETHGEALLVEAGRTDAGKPLHLFIVSRDGTFTPGEIRAAGKSILFINNGIHPGEPCGVDASLKLASGLLSGEDAYARFLDRTAVVIVPLFNVGGALNRSPHHRANQKGPREQGFRGNARNLDLNRDFVKLDSRNARSMVQILRAWDPDIFVDTHTSDGADYAYTITLINSHSQRHEPSQSEYLDRVLLPFLFDAMDQTPYKMSPYVWSIGDAPREGIVGFMDYPRYTSGYVSLFNAFALTVETHMLKPFGDRVRSTWHLLRECLRFSGTHTRDLLEVREAGRLEQYARDTFTLLWQLDTARHDVIPFHGYTAKTRMSKVTGHPVRWYDRQDPWKADIPYYRYFRPVVEVTAPDRYLLPSAWHEVAERLRLNGVKMEVVARDTVLEAEVYYIEDYRTRERPYNGHYRHEGITVRKERERITARAGDMLIPLQQRAKAYLVQTLEPHAYDSFFSWNFFDEILFRNAYFSPWIFDKTAERLLDRDPGLRQDFRRKQSEDPAFSADPYRQLRYIYERSPWSEKSYRRYPVCRLLD